MPVPAVGFENMLLLSVRSQVGVSCGTAEGALCNLTCNRNALGKFWRTRGGSCLPAARVVFLGPSTEMREMCVRSPSKCESCLPAGLLCSGKFAECLNPRCVSRRKARPCRESSAPTPLYWFPCDLAMGDAGWRRWPKPDPGPQKGSAHLC